jgi:hypothetical protein
MNEIRFTTVIGEDQVIRPPRDVKLPKGKAEVIVTQAASQSENQLGNLPQSSWPLVEHLAQLANELGIHPDEFPADIAQNHDYYAHGAPKGIDEQ